MPRLMASRMARCVGKDIVGRGLGRIRADSRLHPANGTIGNNHNIRKMAISRKQKPTA